MDRLISEKQVLDAICHDKCGLSPNRCMSGITGECVQIKPIKAIPSAEPYKGMTNREVLEAVFPNIDFCIKEFDGSIWVDMEDIASFRLDWWNSPYDPQESEDKE